MAFDTAAPAPAKKCMLHGVWWCRVTAWCMVVYGLLHGAVAATLVYGGVGLLLGVWWCIVGCMVVLLLHWYMVVYGRLHGGVA